MKLLIVEDNELNRDMAMDLVQELGLTAEGVDSGKAGLAYLQEHTVDAVLMDYMMPEMDGAEATVKLHELSACENLPVIAMTAEEDPATIQILLESGMCAVLHKPLDPIALYKLLSEYTTEKLLKPVRPSEGSGEKDELREGLEALGFDCEAGIRYTGTAENYRQYAANFARLLPGMLENLSECLKQEDYDTFTVNVHGLKSNFRALGQMELFRECLACEQAGKAGEREHLCVLYREAEKKLQQCLDGLQAVFEGKKELPAMTSHALCKALRELRDAMQTFDLDTADTIVADLEGHAVGEQLGEDLKKLYREVAALKYEPAVHTIDALLENIRGGLYGQL